MDQVPIDAPPLSVLHQKVELQSTCTSSTQQTLSQTVQTQIAPNKLSQIQNIKPPAVKKWRAFFKAKKQVIVVHENKQLKQKLQKQKEQNSHKDKQMQDSDKKRIYLQQTSAEQTVSNLKVKRNSQNIRPQIKQIQAWKQVKQIQTRLQTKQIQSNTHQILTIFDQKQSLLKFTAQLDSSARSNSSSHQNSVMNQNSSPHKNITHPQLNQQKKGFQKNQKNQKQIINLSEQVIKDNKRCKHIGKHFKIFNPQHFQVNQNQQIKTSIHRWLYGSGQTPNKLLISSWNINGIRARMICNDINPYIQNTKPDIFCVNQHKIDQKSFNQSPIKFWGYHSYWNFPKYSLGYSGVAIFSKYPAKQMFQDIHLAQHSKQGRVITLQFDKFILVHAYIPTVGRQLERLKYRVQQWDPAFKQYIIMLKGKYPNKTLILCGDLNVSHKDIDCHVGKRMKQGKQPSFTIRQRTNFNNFLRETQLVDTFRHFHPDSRQYTWWNMRRGGRQRAGQTGIGKRLDYFLVSQQSLKYVVSSQIMKKIKGCDHCPIELKIQFT